MKRGTIKNEDMGSLELQEVKRQSLKSTEQLNLRLNIAEENSKLQD